MVEKVVKETENLPSQAEDKKATFCLPYSGRTMGPLFHPFGEEDMEKVRAAIDK